MTPNKKERPNTYFVQDKSNERELLRLTLQGQMLNTGMGGVLTEQENPSRFKRVLDIGCGTGNWVQEAAETYPEMSAIGVDISQKMITYARAQAKERGLEDRVEFHVMDVLLALEFPNDFFDLVNMRLGFSFLRTWDWPKILAEMLRVTKNEGVIRVVEEEVIHLSNGPAHTRFMEMFVNAFYQAGHIYEEHSTSLVDQLPRMFVQHGISNVQTLPYRLAFDAGTTQGAIYAEDMRHVFQTARPFLEKRGSTPKNYDELYQQALEEMERPDFRAIWPFLAVWGNKQ